MRPQGKMSFETTNNDSIDHQDENAYVRAMELSMSFVLAPVIVASIELDLFGIISKICSGSSNPYVSASEIASHLDTKNPSAPIVLDQILRLLASYSVVTSSYRKFEDGKVEILYGLGPVCRFLLKSENGDSLAPVYHIFRYYDLTKICSGMKESVLEGGSPNMMRFFDAIEKDETIGNDFDKSMSAYTSIIMKGIFTIYTGFEGLKSLVDVGGGVGTCLQMIISNYPSIHGINFDLPRAIQKVSSSNTGIEHVGGDMFVEIPKADAILLKWVLHDWDDEKCMIILKNCYLALPESGKVIVIETILPSVPETSGLAKYASLMDIMMRYIVQARERTELEYNALAKEAGFSKFEVQCCGCGLSVMELYK